MENKHLQLERTVFFCDAVVAIAITLLALDIKIDHTRIVHLTFTDLTVQWKTFAAFVLSFINIANFWRSHHTFFSYICEIDEKLLWFNILWLFFIVLLPFSTSLVGYYFNDTAAMCTYALNILMIGVFQNMIWDHASGDKQFLKEGSIDDATAADLRLFCNLDMVNGIVAVILSFFSPLLAFICLFTKLPLIIIVRMVYGRKDPRYRGGRK